MDNRSRDQDEKSVVTSKKRHSDNSPEISMPDSKKQKNVEQDDIGGKSLVDVDFSDTTVRGGRSEYEEASFETFSSKTGQGEAEGKADSSNASGEAESSNDAHQAEDEVEPKTDSSDVSEEFSEGTELVQSGDKRKTYSSSKMKQSDGEGKLFETAGQTTDEEKTESSNISSVVEQSDHSENINEEGYLSIVESSCSNLSTKVVVSSPSYIEQFNKDNDIISIIKNIGRGEKKDSSDIYAVPSTSTEVGRSDYENEDRFVKEQQDDEKTTDSSTKPTTPESSEYTKKSSTDEEQHSYREDTDSSNSNGFTNIFKGVKAILVDKLRENEFADVIRKFAAYGGTILLNNEYTQATHSFHYNNVIQQPIIECPYTTRHLSYEWIQASIDIGALADVSEYTVQWNPDS